MSENKRKQSTSSHSGTKPRGKPKGPRGQSAKPFAKPHGKPKSKHKPQSAVSPAAGLKPKPNQMKAKTKIQASRAFDNDRKETLTVEKVRSKIQLAAVVDTSGSMSGAPSDAALAAVKELFTDVLYPSDLFSCFTFASNVRTLHKPMRVDKVKWETDEQHIRDNSGGLTALWDGIARAVGSCKERAKQERELVESKELQGAEHKLVTEVVVITDGHDNSSKTSFEEVKQLIAKPGLPDFNLIVIGLGDVDQDKLKELCQPRHARFLHGHDLDKFCRRLSEAVNMIKLRLQVETPDQLSSSVEWQGRQRDAAAALRKMVPSSEMLTGLEKQGALSTLLSHLQITES
jgi:Mg-chelatase subunit ChlD